MHRGGAEGAQFLKKLARVPSFVQDGVLKMPTQKPKLVIMSLLWGQNTSKCPLWCHLYTKLPSWEPKHVPEVLSGEPNIHKSLLEGHNTVELLFWCQTYVKMPIWEPKHA